MYVLFRNNYFVAVCGCDWESIYSSNIKYISGAGNHLSVWFPRLEKALNPSPKIMNGNQTLQRRLRLGPFINSALPSPVFLTPAGKKSGWQKFSVLSCALDFIHVFVFFRQVIELTFKTGQLNVSNSVTNAVRLKKYFKHCNHKSWFLPDQFDCLLF